MLFKKITVPQALAIVRNFHLSDSDSGIKCRFTILPTDKNPDKVVGLDTTVSHWDIRKTIEQCDHILFWNWSKSTEGCTRDEIDLIFDHTHISIRLRPVTEIPVISEAQAG